MEGSDPLARGFGRVCLWALFSKGYDLYRELLIKDIQNEIDLYFFKSGFYYSLTKFSFYGRPEILLSPYCTFV